MAEFGGWDMPIQYAGILHEHLQTRTESSVFDICHMGEFELSGTDAAADLERLLTCRIANMAEGQVRYGFMLGEEGGTIDDLTCYRMAQDRWMLVVNAGTTDADAQWIQSHISPDTVFKNLSPDMAKLDVQGPRSREVLTDILAFALPDLGYFRFAELNAFGTRMILSRTGYTGEWGYEIYLPNADVDRLWQQLVGHPRCKPAGLGARDTLRLEMGYSLYGHELGPARTPAATSRGAFIDTAKEFVGKQQILAELDQPSQLLVGLMFDSKRAARAGDSVWFGEERIGEVTSGSVAPSLGSAVALAFVHLKCSAVGTTLEVMIRGKRFPATIVDLPFYKNGTARGL